MSKTKLKKGDLIKVIAGSHKTTQGPITWISKDRTRVSIQGLEVVKHVKPNNQDSEGGIKKIPTKIDISNIGLLDVKDKTKTTRLGYSINKDGKKVRISRRSKQEIK